MEYQNLFKEMRKDGRVHAAELSKPALKDQDRRYYDAYRSLSASRMWSPLGPNAIPVSEVAAYLSMVGIEDTDTKLKYLRIVQGLDIVEMKSIREQQAKSK